MLARRSRSRIKERKAPGDPEPLVGAPGSIEQQLDMCEEGDLRGDEILHSHGLSTRDEKEDIQAVDELITRFSMTMDEPGREGDEMSGDEHSSGLQGEEPDLWNQQQSGAGLPGEETHQEEKEERFYSSHRLEEPPATPRRQPRPPRRTPSSTRKSSPRKTKKQKASKSARSAKKARRKSA